MELNVIAIVQARMGSSRFPGKILKKVKNKYLIDILLSRLSLSSKINKIIVATSKNSENDILESVLKKKGYDVFRGSEENVLNRYYEVAKKYSPKVIVRITGDCPLIDFTILDEIIRIYNLGKYDYVSNTINPTFPDGLDIEVFSKKALDIAHSEAITTYQKEHVTPYIKENKGFDCFNVESKKDYSKERWTVDDPEDFVVIKNILDHFWPNIYFKWTEVLELKKRNPGLFYENKHIKWKHVNIKLSRRSLFS